MFDFSFEKAAVLKNVVDAIKDLVEVTVLDVLPHGIETQTMDSSHVALVSLSLPAAAFTTYECDGEHAIGVRVEDLSRVLKIAGPADGVRIKSGETDESICITVSGSGGRRAEFSLRLVESDAERMAVGEMDASAKFSMSSAEFARIAKDLGAFGDTMRIEATSAGPRFETKGDMGTARIDAVDEGCESACEEEFALTFGLRYLVSFAKGASLASRVGLALSPDVPILVRYGIEGGGALSFYLAPKIDDQFDEPEEPMDDAE